MIAPAGLALAIFSIGGQMEIRCSLDDGEPNTHEDNDYDAAAFARLEKYFGE